MPGLSVPASTVPVIRAAFSAQGFPANIVSDDGTLDPIGFAALAYDRATVKTAFTPPIEIQLASVTGPPGWFGQLAQPAVVFEGRLGRNLIAPYGEPSGIAGTAVFAGVIALIFGAGYLVGRRVR